MSVKFEDLKVGETYFITNPDNEKVTETILEEIVILLKKTKYHFVTKELDEDGYKINIYLKVKDGEEIFEGEYIKIIPFLTREEAESNRKKILIDARKAIIESYKKDISEREAKIKELESDV